MKKRKPVYSLAIKRYFTAHHFLIGGDGGEENELHSYDYTVEVQLGGSALDELIAKFRDRTIKCLARIRWREPKH